MIVSQREKRVLVLGGASAMVIILFAFVILPLARSWMRLGQVLEPKLQHVQRMQNRIERQNALLLQRDALVKQLGSIVGPDTNSPSGEAPPPNADERGPNEQNKDRKETGPDEAPPGISLAAHLERVAKEAGVQLTKVTPRKPSGAAPDGGLFQAVGLQIGFESNIESLVKLLHGLENGERLVRVEHAEFRRDPGKGPNIRVSLRVVGYESITR